MKRLMFSVNFIGRCVVGIFFMLESAVADAVPKTIWHQGLLVNTNSIPLSTGQYDLTVRMWDEVAGGSNVWTETHSSVPVVQGYFSLELGSITNGLSQALTGESRYVEIGGASITLSRKQIVSVPYSLFSGDTELVGGLDLLQQVEIMQRILEIGVEGEDSGTEFSLIPAGRNSGSYDEYGEDNWSIASYDLEMTNAYYMGRYEVTLALWQDVASWGKTNEYVELSPLIGSADGSSHPVYDISPDEIMQWCNARSERDNLLPCYYTDAGKSNIYMTGAGSLDSSRVDWNATGYRLPTNDEWEYAARGGVQGRPFPWGHMINHQNANYTANNTNPMDVSPSAVDQQHPLVGSTTLVGRFPPNGFGLFDIVGNVHELTWEGKARGGGYESSASVCTLEFWDPSPSRKGFRLIRH